MSGGPSHLGHSPSPAQEGTCSNFSPDGQAQSSLLPAGYWNVLECSLLLVKNGKELKQGLSPSLLSLTDSHEDHACCYVQAPYWPGDPTVHLGPP